LTEYTRPATWEDLKILVGFLRDAGVEYALVGGEPLGLELAAPDPRLVQIARWRDA
jgi:hypothetical protein